MADVQRQQTPAGERRRPRKLNKQPTRNGTDDNKENELLTQPEVPVESGYEGPGVEESLPQDSASSPPRQQRRRKPRKLLRGSPGRHQTAEEATASPNSHQEILSVRVGQLEQHVVSLNRRLDTHALNIATLQATHSTRGSVPRPRGTRVRSSRLASRAPSVASAAQTDRTENSGRVGDRVDEEEEGTQLQDFSTGVDYDTLPPFQRALFRNINAATDRISRRNPPVVAAGPSSRPTGAVVEELDEAVPATAAANEGNDGIETVPSSSAQQERNVSLSGRYRIPLPSTINTSDVRALRSGVAAAGSIAREISAAIRGGRSYSYSGGYGATSGSDASGALLPEQQPLVSDAVKETETLDGVTTPRSPRSWAALLGDAGRIVANAAGRIEVDAAVEARPDLAEVQSADSRTRAAARGPGAAAAAARRRRALPAPGDLRGARTQTGTGAGAAARQARRNRPRAARTGKVGDRNGEASAAGSAQSPGPSVERQPSSSAAGAGASAEQGAAPGNATTAAAEPGEAEQSRPTSSRGVNSSLAAGLPSPAVKGKGKESDKET